MAQDVGVGTRKDAGKKEVEASEDRDAYGGYDAGEDGWCSAVIHLLRLKPGLDMDYHNVQHVLILSESIHERYFRWPCH